MTTTVGIDIGTSSVKAVAADADGTIVARARVAHPLYVPTPGRFEHPAEIAWRDGPRAALAELLAELDEAPAGVCVAAMVPSLTAVDAAGVPLGPGLLYGDERGRGSDHELSGFLRWSVDNHPDAAGHWPAQAVANQALAGDGVVSTTVAASMYPLFDWTGWDADRTAAAGARPEQLPRITPSGQPAADVPGAGVLEGGTIDALAEQLVAGADEVGDVLVICGTTLIVWVVTAEERAVPGLLSIPHTTPGRWLVGGPSNAGGLFLDWARGLLADTGAVMSDPASVPVWVPYPRGERAPLHDPDRRGSLVDLDLTHGAAAIERAAFEAAGFVTRRMVDAVGEEATRIVATGGGTQAVEWMHALADATGLPVDVAARPDGAALGAAFCARVAAGLEPDTTRSVRWARTGRRVRPDPAWRAAMEPRYERFRELAD